MVKAVGRLFKEDDPALRIFPGAAIVEVMYIFGDASGSGFGLSWT